DVADERDRERDREGRGPVGRARRVQKTEPPHACGEADGGEREVKKIGARERREQGREAEDETAQRGGASRPDLPADERREERCREHRARHDRELRVRRAEERELEGGAPRADVREEE